MADPPAQTAQTVVAEDNLGSPADLLVSARNLAREASWRVLPPPPNVDITPNGEADPPVHLPNGEEHVAGIERHPDDAVNDPASGSATNDHEAAAEHDAGAKAVEASPSAEHEVADGLLCLDDLNPVANADGTTCRATPQLGDMDISQGSLAIEDLQQTGGFLNQDGFSKAHLQDEDNGSSHLAAFPALLTTLRPGDAPILREPSPYQPLTQTEVSNAVVGLHVERQALLSTAMTVEPPQGLTRSQVTLWRAQHAAQAREYLAELEQRLQRLQVVGAKLAHAAAVHGRSTQILASLPEVGGGGFGEVPVYLDTTGFSQSKEMAGLVGAIETELDQQLSLVERPSSSGGGGDLRHFSDEVTPLPRLLCVCVCVCIVQCVCVCVYASCNVCVCIYIYI